MYGIMPKKTRNSEPPPARDRVRSGPPTRRRIPPPVRVALAGPPTQSTARVIGTAPAVRPYPTRRRRPGPGLAPVIAACFGRRSVLQTGRAPGTLLLPPLDGPGPLL